jgi:hypothetical protein
LVKKKQHVRQGSSKPKDDVCRVSDRMPEWAREYLSDNGIEGEFRYSLLSKEQCLALELAERLFHQESQGQIRVTYDPRKHTEPQPEYAQETGNSALDRQGEVE